MAGKRAIRATQKSSAGYCQERAGRATARVPTTPLHCPRPYNDGDSRERVERLLRSPERAIEGPLLRSSTGIASDRYVWCFLFKTRFDRTTASVLARSANDAGASTDCVSQAERKAPISYCKTPTNAAARLLTSVSQVGVKKEGKDDTNTQV